MISVSIDGPAGAGKSSVARDVAKKLGFIYVDTGAIYRAFALHIINSGVSPENQEEVSKAVTKANITIDYLDSHQRTFLNGVDVSDKIRSSDVSMATAIIARNPDVRTSLISLQRTLAKDNDVIMDGRDIGTVVLPKADVKIYLTASPEERAKRRLLQLEKKGICEEYEIVLNQILERDYNDINKSRALRRADDAVIIDNTNSTKKETIEAIITLILEKKRGEAFDK